MEKQDLNVSVLREIFKIIFAVIVWQTMVQQKK